jgi:hypothetical protein
MTNDRWQGEGLAFGAWRLGGFGRVLEARTANCHPNQRWAVPVS